MTIEPDGQDVPLDNIGQRARSAAGWQFLSKGINTGLQMATSVVLARLLMPKDFGIVAMAMMTTGLAAVFQDLGLGQALVQRREIAAEHTRCAFWGTLMMGVLLCGLAVLIAPYVGAFFDEPRMVPVLRLVSLTFVVSPFAVVPRSLLQRNLDFRTPFFAGLASSVAYGGMGITMAVLGYGYWSLAGASLASGFVGTVALCILTRYTPPLIPALRGIKDLYSFGAGVTAIGLFGFLAHQADYFVIGRRLDADALGLYERAYKLMMLPLFLPWQLGVILFPAFSQMQDDRGRARNALGRVVTITTVLTWPFLALLLVVAPEFVPLVFGQQWTEAVLPVQVLILAGFTKVLVDVMRSATKAMGARYVWGEAWRLATYALLLGAGAWWGANWGIAGVAWAATGASLVLLALSLHLLQAATGFGPGDCLRAVVAPLIIAGLAGVLTLVLRGLLLSTGIAPWYTLLGASMGGAFSAVLGVRFLPSTQLAGVQSEMAIMVHRIRQRNPS